MNITHPSQAPRRRRRGAPLGNQNALKHGFYSHAFTDKEKKHLSIGWMGEFRDEELLMGILINRAWQQLQDPDMPGTDWMEALRTLSHAVGRKESLARTRRLIFQQTYTPQAVLDELAKVPFEQD